MSFRKLYKIIDLLLTRYIGGLYHKNFSFSNGSNDLVRAEDSKDLFSFVCLLMKTI